MLLYKSHEKVKAKIYGQAVKNFFPTLSLPNSLSPPCVLKVLRQNDHSKVTALLCPFLDHVHSPSPRSRPRAWKEDGWYSVCGLGNCRIVHYRDHLGTFRHVLGHDLKLKTGNGSNYSLNNRTYSFESEWSDYEYNNVFSAFKHKHVKLLLNFSCFG